MSWFIVVSIRYNSNLKIFNNSSIAPILQPRNRVYYDRIPTLNHVVNPELWMKGTPIGRPSPLCPVTQSHRWWRWILRGDSRERSVVFGVKSCSLTWKTAMILWLKTYATSTWQRKIVTPSWRHNFTCSIFIVKCCWIFHCDGIKSWHTQRNFDIEHEAGRYMFQLERDEKELSRNTMCWIAQFISYLCPVSFFANKSWK